MFFDREPKTKTLHLVQLSINSSAMFQTDSVVNSVSLLRKLTVILMAQRKKLIYITSHALCRVFKSKN